MLEIVEQALKLSIKYGPTVYAAVKGWAQSLMASPKTTPEEKAGLEDLLARMDDADRRVDEAPDIPRREE